MSLLFRRLTFCPELIDKCVGSKIWVVMKGDKGKQCHSSSRRHS